MAAIATQPMPIRYRQILAIAWPVLIANLAMPLQGAIDVAVVGHFPQSASLAGLGIASQLWLLILVSFNFLQYASSGLSAQALGKLTAAGADPTPVAPTSAAASAPYQSGHSSSHSPCQSSHNDLADILYRSLGVALLLGGVLWGLQAPIVSYGLDLLAALPSSRQQADTYLSIRYYGIVFELMNYAFIGWFAGQGKTLQIMAVQFIISLINIVLTLFFVYQLDLGLQGVAWGTVIGYGLGCGVSMYLAQQRVHHLNAKYAAVTVASAQAQVTLSIRLLAIFAAHKMLRLFSLNKDIFIRTLLLTLSFAWITRLSAQQGDLVMATNALLLQVLSISAFALDGVAVASESLSGQAAAHKNSALFAQVLKRTGLIVLGLAVSMSLIWLVALPSFLALMTNLAPVTALALDYRLVAALLPLAGAAAYWLDGIMFGLTAGSKIRNVALIVAGLFFPLSAVLAAQFGERHPMPVIWFSVYWLLLSRGLVAAIVLWRDRKRILSAP